MNAIRSVIVALSISLPVWIIAYVVWAWLNAPA